MRDLKHENVNQFVGASMDLREICIVSEYCSRGSLEDILNNDEMKLDDMFVASLVFIVTNHLNINSGFKI